MEAEERSHYIQAPPQYWTITGIPATRPQAAQRYSSIGGNTTTSSSSNGGVAGVDLTNVADRVVGGITLSRQGSLSTLRAQPVRNPPSAQRRPSAPPPSYSLSAAYRITSDSDNEEENLPRDDNLRIPWRSLILPSPRLSRRKSNIKMKSSNIERAGSSPSSSLSAPTSPASLSANNTSDQRYFSLNSSNGSQQSSPCRSYTDDFAAPVPPPFPSGYPLYASCYCEENAYLLAAYLSRICHSWNKHERSSFQESHVKWSVDVVVVSNKSQMVALWEQKAGSSAANNYQVVWDYHVFVVVSCRKSTSGRVGTAGPSTSRARPNLFSMKLTDARLEAEAMTTVTSSWVYDLDSRLEMPTPLVKYLSVTFGIESGEIDFMQKRFQPLFRVIPAADYFTRFGSDRSHMKKPTSPGRETVEWIQPRPEWDLILGCKASHVSNYFMDSFVDMRVKIGDGRFGVIVKLEDFINSRGLMADKDDDDKEDVLAAGVAVLLDRIPGSDFEQQAIQREDTTIPMEEDEKERTPGILIGGIQRYGLRPPPPPPDGAIIPTNRGKRIMDPLYPAYISRVYESRLADEESRIVHDHVQS